MHASFFLQRCSYYSLPPDYSLYSCFMQSVNPVIVRRVGLTYFEYVHRRNDPVVGSSILGCVGRAYNWIVAAMDVLNNPKSDSPYDDGVGSLAKIKIDG